MVLVLAPTVVPTTSTVSVQVAPAAIVPPTAVTLVALGAALNVPPGHPPEALGVGATFIPMAPRLSVRPKLGLSDEPFSGRSMPVVELFLIVIVIWVAAPSGTDRSWKVLVIVGCVN